MKSRHWLFYLRCATFFCALTWMLGGEYPPAKAQQGSSEATDVAVIHDDIGHATKDISDLNDHLKATDDRVNRQYASINQNASDIAVMRGQDEQNKWWIGLLAALTGGQLIWTVRKEKKA